ncbi:MAG TPA: ABC transporter permease [Gryllotalpicola sp.]
MTAAERSSGLTARYRAWYEKLPISVQMIGMQLWMPVFFVFAFVFCYLFAFHAPAFQNVPVAVVGPAAQMQPVAEQLQSSSHGAVLVSVVRTLDEARDRVRDGDVAAAYAPGVPASSDVANTATVVIASADSYQLSSLAKAFFQTVATQSKAVLTVDDLAPLPAWDSFGTSLFYLTLVCTITSHLTAMFVGMMGGGLKHWQRFAIFGAGSILLPGIAVMLSRFVVHAVAGHVLWLWLIGSATGFAVGCVVNGLSYFAGRFIAAYALLLFVFLNVPGSGGAYPPELLPQPFRWLHGFVTGTATVDLFRKHEYGVGPAQWQGWLLLAAYVAAGIVLALIGKPFLKWKNERRVRLGRRPSMMVTAQATSLIHAGFVAPLSKAGKTNASAGPATDAAEPARRRPQPGAAPVPEPVPAPPPTPEPRPVTAAVRVGTAPTATGTADAGDLPRGHGRRAAPVDDAVIKAETQALEIIEQRVQEDLKASSAGAEGDAAAAETGAAG